MGDLVWLEWLIMFLLHLLYTYIVYKKHLQPWYLYINLYLEAIGDVSLLLLLGDLLSCYRSSNFLKVLFVRHTHKCTHARTHFIDQKWIPQQSKIMNVVQRWAAQPKPQVDGLLQTVKRGTGTNAKCLWLFRLMISAVGQWDVRSLPIIANTP